MRFFSRGDFGQKCVNGAKQRILVALRQVINLLNATQQAAVGRRVAFIRNTYDANGRQWTSAPAGGGLLSYATNTYDAVGERVQVTDGAGSWQRRFIYDAGGQLIAEYTAQGLAIENIYRNGQLLTKRETAGGVTHISWVMSDHQGSSRVTTNANGQVTGRTDYAPLGEELGAGVGGRTTGQGYTGADSVKQKFTGHERDFETGLDYMKARYFSSVQGRFTSPDGIFNDLTCPHLTRPM